MYDPEHGWNLSFAGCGFLGSYHVGVTRCLSERAPHLLRDARMFFGASAGALHCVAFLAGFQTDQILRDLAEFVRCARSRSIGILHPSFDMSGYIRKYLHRQLPANIHQLISGKICISLTRVSDWENVLVSDFQSKDEVVDALVCSCFIPFFCGVIPPSFRGQRYVDGGTSNNLPFSDSKTTITVSPFYGEYDICPKVKSTNFLHVDIIKLSLRLCSENLRLVGRALFPPDIKVLGEICLRGYLDAARFLEENGISDKSPLCPSLSSEEPEVLSFSWETMSLEASPEGAAWQTRPKENELLDHLRVSPLPWDESTLETLSPKLTAALREMVKNRDGYLSKIYTFLPVRVLSYVLLPCTLPVESAVATVQRLVAWLPHIPDDIQWLQSITSQTCSRVMMHLFPTFRPAASQARSKTLQSSS